MIPIGEAWPNLPDIAARKVEIPNTETETQSESPCLSVLVRTTGVSVNPNLPI